MKKYIELPADYTLVLRHIQANEQEEFITLAESLRFNQSRLAHIIQSLQHKGLVLVSRSTYTDAWISLSKKGNRLLGVLMQKNHHQFLSKS